MDKKTTKEREMKMKNNEIKSILSAEMVSKKRNGNYIARWTYFYRMGKDSDTYKERVQKRLPSAVVVDCGDHYANFNGGASIQNSSHFWVEFNL